MDIMVLLFVWSMICSIMFPAASHAISLADSSNLFQNADFEEVFASSNWFCNGCDQLERSSDSFQGNYSAKVTGRSRNFHGVRQTLDLKPNGRYKFTIHVKLLNQYAEYMAHQVGCTLAVSYEDGQTQYISIGTEPYLRQSQGWQKIGGDVKLQNKAITSARFYISMPEEHLEYLVDTAHCSEITLEDNWREQADERIEQIRKNKIVINLNTAEYVPSSLTVEVRQTYQEFPFGMMLHAWRLMEPGTQYDKYRQIFYDHFNWSVFGNAMKWKVMENPRGIIDYLTADLAMNTLLSQGIKLRGHCMFWGVDKHIPSWLPYMTPEQVRQEIERRIQYAGPHYKGRIEHWDVNNEQLHGSFYEQSTGSDTILAEMFSKIREQDEDVKLYLNDYNVISSSGYTYAMLKSAAELKSHGAPLDGIGVQSHFRSLPDVARVKSRLDALSEAELPVWVTELDVEITDIDLRARGYEDILRLYYSHPSVDGIIIWGFWDQVHWRPGASLVDGDDLETNKAGRRVFDLISNQWKTSGDFQPTAQQNRFELRGFHGDYEIDVKWFGIPIFTQTFSLLKGKDISVDVNLW